MLILHQDIYNSSEFNLRDPDDPLLQEGTSKTSFSAGLGAVYLPFKNLAFGMSIDQINRPGVSIETDRAFRPMLIKAGFCHQFHNLISELNYVHIQYKNRNEKYFAFGLRQLLLEGGILHITEDEIAAVPDVDGARICVENLSRFGEDPLEQNIEVLNGRQLRIEANDLSQSFRFIAHWA